MSEITHTLPDPQTRPTITIDEAAAFLGIGRATAYRAAQDGSIPTVKYGRRLLVPTASFRRSLGIDDGPPRAA